MKWYGLYGVRPSVPARAHSSKPAAVGLLLWAQRKEAIDRLLQQRRANAGSGTLSAYVGSRTHFMSIRMRRPKLPSAPPTSRHKHTIISHRSASCHRHNTNNFIILTAIILQITM